MNFFLPANKEKNIRAMFCLLEFICSEKATNFCKISTVDLSYVVMVKSTVKISQNFVVFSEFMNFEVHWFIYYVTYSLKVLDLSVYHHQFTHKYGNVER